MDKNTFIFGDELSVSSMSFFIPLDIITSCLIQLYNSGYRMEGEKLQNKVIMIRKA